MPSLPESDMSLLVLTDFASKESWQQVWAEAQDNYEDGFQANVDPVDDPAFDGATWQEVKAAMPVMSDRPVAVLFIGDHVTLTSPEHPILAVDLSDSPIGEPTFRCLPSELWGVENNLNLWNMAWHEFADAVDDDGIFRGFAR
jgi:hypothetical protein